MEPQQGKLAGKIKNYIQTRKVERLEKFDKEAAKQQSSDPNNPILADDLAKQRQAVVEKFDPAIWLSDAAARAKQLKFVTHALKFIHSDAKGTNLFAEYPGDLTEGIVGSQSLQHLDFDVVGNAAALDVGKLLLLGDAGQRLVDYVQRGDTAPLQPFTTDSKQAQDWLNGFAQVLAVEEFSSHKLAKQVYWPLDQQNYHLLLPLYASSLAQGIYQQIQHSRYSDAAKATRERRRKGEYADQPDIRYTDIAVQSFGGTKPQNISQLNSQRGGKVYLLSSSPPSWNVQAKPPLHMPSIFTHFVGPKLRKKTAELKGFLRDIAPLDSTVELRNKRADLVQDIVYDTISLAAFIQSLPGGWSADTACALPQEERLWLDPDRAENDPVFAAEREQNDWQLTVANNFARWLAHTLESKTLAFGKVEQREFRDAIEAELRLNSRDIEGVKL